jgi:serine/threonine-protein phosphatase 5
MNRNYGFEAEVLRKYSRATLVLFQRLFRSLPFAAVIEDSVFVCHGGLGPLSYKMTIAEINKVDRFREPAHNSAMFEIMWCGE